MPGDPLGYQAIDFYTERGTLQIEIAGTDDSIPQYDYIEVVWAKPEIDPTGSTLELKFRDSFNEEKLNDGDYFDIIRYSSANPISGTYGSIDDSQAPLERGMWSLSYDQYVDAETSAVRLTYIRTCMCDFEPAAGDGDVDGADLAAYLADQAGITVENFAFEFGEANCP